MKLLQIFAILATLLICKPALATPAVYFGAYVNPEGLSVQKSDIDDCSRTVRQMAAFKSLTGTYPTYAHCWINNGVVDPKDPGKFPIDSLNKMYALGITPVLNVRCDTPARLLAGADDVYYRNFAKAAAAFGHPILFRGTGWEFNISDIHSCNTQSNPAGFVAGWQHIHDIFVQEGATNVLWAWVPAAPRVPAAVLPFYPGDVYVDRIMFDHYPAGTEEEDFTATTNPLPANLTYWCNRGKSCGIAETAALPQNQSAFFNSITNYLLGKTSYQVPVNFNMLLIFDCPGGENAGHANAPWPLSSTGASAWRNMVNVINPASIK